MKRILVATDGSTGADRAVDAASELAKQFGAELLIATVEQGYMQGELDELRWAKHATVEEVLTAVSREVLKRAGSRAQAIGIEASRTFTGLGDAAGFILEGTEREKPDLIGVGKRGRGRLGGLLLGSVSQKVVSLAPCGVHVVP